TDRRAAHPDPVDRLVPPPAGSGVVLRSAARGADARGRRGAAGHAGADVTVARYLCLAGPALLVLAGARVERDRTALMAALLAFIAAAVGIAALTPVAGRLGWWRFAVVDGSMRGLPVDAWLGWAAL